MERDLDVRTAEAVAVRFELAGLGSRFLALAADFALQAVVAIVALIAFALLPAPLRRPEAFWIATGSIAAFALFFGYFIIFELFWNGQSPGKRLVGLRVIRDGGFPIDAGASVVRNAVRIVEAGLGFYVISGFVTLLSPENKRLGDFAAGTIVVRDNAAAIPSLATLTVEADQDANDGLVRDDRVLIERYLARRPSLDAAASRAIAAAIAARIRPKLRASFDYLDDLDLLEHIARSNH